MNNVYQLSNEMLLLDAAIDRIAEANDGEVDSELVDAFDAIVQEFESQADGLANLLRKRRNEAEQFRQQAKRFHDVASRIDKQNDTLKRCIIDCMSAAGMKKHGAFSVCKNGGKLPLVFTGDVPEGFTKIQRTTDSEMIRETLEAGQDLSFAELGERGSHLRLRA